MFYTVGQTAERAMRSLQEQSVPFSTSQKYWLESQSVSKQTSTYRTMVLEFAVENIQYGRMADTEYYGFLFQNSENFL